ncbi:TRAP transporter small permease [Microbacterium sp. NPDC077644]|uniref:TRAP transporter small permease n=1 Tax=Microbacterium sp. NPDC077644 TaxID=3155055 RepID=UPI00344CFCD0
MTTPSENAAAPRWFRAIEYIAGAAILVIMVHTLANVAARALFNSPLPDTNEWSAFWYLPIAALGGFILAQFAGEHIEATLIYDRLDARNRHVLDIGATLVSIAVSCAFAWFTAMEAAHATSIGLRAGVTSVVIWPIKWLVPLTFVLLVILMVAKVVSLIRNRQTLLLAAVDASPIPGA